MIKKFIIAIDLGGTNLKCALLDLNLKIKAKTSFGTKSFNNKEKLIQGIADSINNFILKQKLSKSAILGVGIGLPGPVDTFKGVVYFLPNIPGWKEVNIRNILEHKIKLPVFIDNDAKLMCLAESKAGSAAGYSNALCLTLGTGVGAGLIINGALYRGADNAAGEFGHLPINEKGPLCGCGARACLEAYIGNKAIIKKAKTIFGLGISLEKISRLAKQNNRQAVSFWNEIGKKLGLALSGVINLLNLDVVVIGGGVAGAGKSLFTSVKKTILSKAMSVQARRARVFKAKLGVSAGIIGAGYLVKERISKKSPKFKRFNLVILFLSFIFALNANLAIAEEAKESPIIINGDNVEYSTDNRQVTATGNIEVTYKGSKLTCNKLQVNMQTKEGLAEGNARLEDDKGGVVTGERIIYDFANKTGVIYNADFRANPYFGKARKVQKVSDTEFTARSGYFTTCSMDHPHYRFAAKKINMFPGDKVQAKQGILYLGSVPLIYLPHFNYSMKEPIMHVQVEPGKSKDWGMYLLSVWRMNLTEHVNARAFLDYRSKLGLGEGFEVNYTDSGFGKGDFKFYYTNEKPDSQPSGAATEFQRYFMRWRHKWDIDPRTNVVAELYKITDQRRKYDSSHNILKDYFFREYEKDSQPLSYGLFHHSFDYSSLDILLQMRTNHWFDQIEKIPEINYNLPSLQLGETPFYFEDTTQFGNYNKKGTGMGDDTTVVRLDTTNKVSVPTKVGFVQFKPFVSSRQTFYDKGANGQAGIVRTVFYSGADLSTKFFRIFDVKTNFMNLDINGLRHVITPTIGYLYTHVPTIPGTNIKQIEDSIDNIHRGNTATLGLSNKLQTKRNGQSIDFVDFLITTDYVLDPKTGDNAILTPTEGGELKNNFSDILFKLKVLPYSWMRLESDVTFEHSARVLPSGIPNVNYNKFSLANYDLIFDLGKERSLTVGQRYERKGNNEVTLGFNWRLTPKWKFAVYQRYNYKKSATLDRGYQEQQFTITRDLHCWEVEMSLDKRKNSGSSIYFTFRLKAFPENEFGFDQTVNKKESGAP